MALQQYLMGDLQKTVDEDLKPTLTELMHNEPYFQRGKRYRLLNGLIIEISGIFSRPAPEDRKAPGPAWDFFYWVAGWSAHPVPEEELLNLVDSTRPVGGPRLE